MNFDDIDKADEEQLEKALEFHSNSLLERVNKIVKMDESGVNGSQALYAVSLLSYTLNRALFAYKDLAEMSNMPESEFQNSMKDLSDLIFAGIMEDKGNDIQKI